jgi:nucleoside-diphosphate-sugar epimerase
MKKYVVTGGAGFIGSMIVRQLLGRADGSVTVIDNLLTGHRHNLADVADKVDLHQVDICDAAALTAPMAGADTVFHIAAIPSVPRSINDPDPSHHVNLNGTWNVLRQAQQAGVRRVVYAASSSAYGNTDVLPKVETMQPRPLSPYASQKLMGEYYMSNFATCFNMETVSLRFFNVFGPRQDPGSAYSGVLSLFMRCLIEGKTPTIFGDGEQTRDFTYVEDVADLVIKASLAPGMNGQTYNAGNGNRYSLNQTWELLQKITGITIKANYGPPRAGDVRDSQADTTAAVRDLGHAPQFSFEEGLRRTFAWYKEDFERSQNKG